MASERGNSPKRLYLLAAVFLFWILAIAARLVYLQVIQYGQFVQRAQRQQQRSIPVAPRRGIIYDRNGHELAMSVTVDSIFAVPSEVADHETAAALLSRVLNVHPQELVSKFKSSRSFVWVARKVDAPVSARVRALKLRGIYFEKESKRYYPKRDLASQVMGWVGMDDEGLGGIEYAFDQRLRGKPGAMIISLDARRRWFGRVEKRPEPGENVVLTIDEKIQYIAERELEAAIKETGSEAGTIIVQDPRTGEILALANRPSFNPNTFREASREALKNRAVSDIYEPGSTFKLVMMSAALEEKVTQPDEVHDCQNGTMMVGNIRVRDYKAFGLLNTEKVLANSSGICAIKLGLRLGSERFARYIRAFGFGEPTGIELPGETRGMTKPASRWSKTSLVGISRGYEVGVSAVQLVSMVSTIASSGVYTPPRIVAGITPPQDTPQTIVFQPAEQRRVISPLTGVRMKRMMEDVVLFGTGRKAILDGYTSGGKTGTAQKVDPVTGAYHPWKHVASFVGFAPVNEPRISVVVILDSAQGWRHQGGQIAAPVFARVAQQVLTYMQVPHDVEPRNPQRLQLRASARDEDLGDAADPGGSGLDLSGVVAAETHIAEPPTQTLARVMPATSREVAFVPPPKPAPGKEEEEAPAPLPLSGTVVVDVEGGVLVPSLLGKPLRAAIEVAQDAGLELDAIGSGVAREQNPPPGARIARGSRISVRFSR